MKNIYSYELGCQYDTRQSFYKKAFVYVYEINDVEQKQLLSYGTLVANYVYYKNKNKKVYEYLGKYSGTTTRHQKEFFRQLGLTERELKDLFKNGRLEKESE